MSLLKRNGDVFPSLFSDFFNVDDFFNTLPVFKSASLPAVNVKETDQNFEIQMAAPGLKKEDFKISVNNRILTISSEKKEEKEEKSEKFTRKEFNYSSFQRSFTLPESASEDDIKAKYENGVLLLSVAKKEEAKKKPMKEIQIG